MSLEQGQVVRPCEQGTQPPVVSTHAVRIYAGGYVEGHLQEAGYGQLLGGVVVPDCKACPAEEGRQPADKPHCPQVLLPFFCYAPLFWSLDLTCSS